AVRPGPQRPRDGDRDAHASARASFFFFLAARFAFDAFGTTAAFTHSTGGKPSATRCHESPSLRDAKSFPLRAPKYTPGSSRLSVTIASRRTVSNASFWGRPRVIGFHDLPPFFVRYTRSRPLGVQPKTSASRGPL